MWKAVRTAVLALSLALAGGAGRAEACELEQGERRAVARVIDSETLALDDGRQVRLIGALGPRHQDAEAEALFWQPEVDARAALERLVAGQSVDLGFAGRRVDRNGRLLAHVFIAGTEPRVWIQGEMIKAGHARAYVLPGSTACVDMLMLFERTARDLARGLWRNAAYQVRPGDLPWPIAAARDRFQIVEGIVTNAGDVRGQVYLNFGADWRTDFTVHLTATGRRALVDRGIDAAALAGARVRVRGWVTWRNGPYIELADASDLEIIEPATTASDAATAEPEPTRRMRRAAAPPWN